MSQARESFFVNRGLTPLQPNEIEKLKLQGNIILGDFVFNTIDEFGVTWVISDIEGWWQHPSAEVPDIERGWGDGSYDVQGKYVARSLNLTGTFLVPDPALVEAARDRLVAATNLVYRGAWLKTGNNPIRASFVRLAGDVEINTVNARGRTEFSIPLRAPDPIKYAWNDVDPEGYNYVEIPARNSNLSYEGIGIVTNIGNYPVPCYLEITGEFTSPGEVWNRTTNQLIGVTQGLKGSVSRNIVNKQLEYNVEDLTDIATLTTTVKHDFKAGDSVYVSGVGEPFDGDQLVISVPTDTTFTFAADAATVRNVSHKTLQNNVATIETTTSHGFTSGQQITVAGVDAVFDGNYSITSTPSSTTFTFPKTRIPPRNVISAVLVSNIATLTTSDPHQFILREAVTITGIDENYNRVSATIIDIPSPNQFTYAATRTNARDITSKRMTNDVVTLTTSEAHGFIAAEPVNITGVDISLNGGYTISSTTSDTFSYKRVRSTQKSVAITAVSGDTVTVTTSDAHNFLVGEDITIEGSSTLDGTHTITTLPSSTTFTFTKTGLTSISATTVNNVVVRSRKRIIRSRELIGNIATITTTNTHGIIIGEQVVISGIDATFNGTYTVASIPTANTFTYQKTASNVPTANVTGAFVEIPGTVTSQNVVPEGQATVAGTLAFQGVNGVATVSENIPRTFSAGKAIEKNDIQFTPGIVGASAVLSADILEIDTKNKEVAFNGDVDGARGRIDILADFIEIAPGENQIEFYDNGNPESTASLRVYYRSGWLG
jgi:Phage tail protein